MKRILQVFAEPILYGGQESALMNFYRAIDKENYQFDFFTPFEAENTGMIDEIHALGGEVYNSNKPFESRLRKHYFTTELKKFITAHPYEIVHINSGSSYALAHGAKICKNAGIPKVIVHSHASGVESIKHKIVRLLYDPYFIKYPDYCIGCSKLVAEWKYPKSVLNSDKCRIVYNGIDTKKFAFSEEKRNRKRAELGLTDEFVLGSVGRLSPEKNPLFTVDVFKELAEKAPNCKLLMVGSGILKEEVEKKISEYGLKERFIHLENRSDVNELMCAMDALVFPSFYEGFPVVLVEAQSTGLTCICSDAITKEVVVNDNVKYLALGKPVDEWTKELLSVSSADRYRSFAIMEQSEFSLWKCVAHLMKMYD
jgi:glycosyltransferase involved in cell wall biosynthesis